MRTKMDDILDKVAKTEGYDDQFIMFMDYGLWPTVRVPNHKKHEIIPIFLKALKKSIKTKSIKTKRGR